jgi:hypothetical protein
VNYLNPIKWLALASLCVVMSACNTITNSVTVVKQGACRQNQPAGLHLVKDVLIRDSGGGAFVSNKSLKPKDDENLADDSFWLVRVDMGQQPSGGYGLKLLSDKLAVKDQTARFALQWAKPEAGKAQIQILTYPCLYLKVAKGDYKRLQVVDEEGTVRHSLDLP